MRRLAPLCLLTLATAAALAGCTQFPELEHTQTAELDAADYPALVPIDPILASIDAPATDPVQTDAALNARLAGLRARANGLRGMGLTAAERRRLEQGLR